MARVTRHARCAPEFAAALSTAALAIGVIAWQSWTGITLSAAHQRSHVTELAQGFVGNAGMFEPLVAYWNRNSLGDTYVLGDGRLLHALPAGSVEENGATKRRVWVIVERTAGVARTPIGSRELDATTSYIAGDAPEATPFRSYAELNIVEAWRGIDLSIQHAEGGIERVFTVQPGARPDQIRIALDGVSKPRLTRDGELRFTTGVGEVVYRRPFAYQVDDAGKRAAVPVAYEVIRGRTEFGFVVGRYDKSRPLVIDPVLQGTYLGDFADQQVNAMAIDPASGDILVAGIWSFGVPPAVEAGFQTVAQVSAAFITRTDAKLERVIRSTLLGGNSVDAAYAIAVNPRNGEVIIGGTTASATFPGGGGSDEPVLPPGTLGASFVSRLSPDLRRLEQTSYFSATLGSERVWDIAVNPASGDIYVVGYDLAGAIVTRYDEQLEKVLARRAIQGNVEERAKGVAVNPVTGDVYVVGTTNSWDFPQLEGGAFSSTEHPVPFDFGRVFVARFDASLDTHFQSTWLIEGEGSELYGPRMPVIVDPGSGDVIVSTAAYGDPGPLVGGAQPNRAGGETDAVIVRFTADLTQVRGATYFGGEGVESVSSIGLSPNGQSIFLGGTSNSPTLPGSPASVVPDFNAMVTRLNAGLSTIEGTIIYSSPFRSNGNAMQVHSLTGEPYLAGIAGDRLPGTHGGFQPEFSVQTMGSYDSFIARFDPQLATTDSTTPSVFSFPAQSGVASGSLVTSPSIRIYGYTAPIPITVSNGSYSVDDGAFTTADGSLQPGEKVRLQHTAALAPGASTQTLFVAAGVTGTFESVTQSGTTVTPAPFSFAPIDPAAPDIRVTSDVITVQGTDAPSPISVTGGEYSIDGGPFTSVPRVVHAGQSVTLSHTTSSASAAQTNTVLTIGGRSATFSSVTEPLNLVPHAFTFPAYLTPDYTMEADTEVESHPAVVTGINGLAPIAVAGGEYRVNAGAWTTTPGLVANLDYVNVRLHTGAPGTTTVSTVTIGGVSGDFIVEVPGPIPATQIPDAFTLRSVNGVETYQWVDLDPVVLTGYSEPAIVSFSSPGNGLGQSVAEWYNPALEEFFPLPGRLPPGEPLRVRLFVYPDGGTTGVNVNVGGTSAVVTITGVVPGGSTTPTAFQFEDHLNVAPASVIVSETVRLEGLGAPSSVSVSGCQVGINAGAFGFGGPVVNGDTLTLRITAPSGSGQSASCSVTVGAYTESVRITTSGNSSGGGNGGGGGGSLDAWSILFLGALMIAWRRTTARPTTV